MNVTLNRQLLGLEDLAFGVGTVTQTRGGISGDVTLINAANMPFDASFTLQQVLDTNYASIATVGADLINIDLVATNITSVNSVAAIVDDLATAIAAVAITNADVVLTHADVVLTNADAASTALDKIATNADAASTASDKIATNADAASTALDKVATNADAASTALDKIATNADVVLTNADVVLTHADVVLTHADVVSTAASAASTAADKLAIETIYDNFDDRYLGSKASDPTLDNDGNALQIGAMYFNTTVNNTRFYNGATWEDPEETATTSAATATTKAAEASSSATDAQTAQTAAETAQTNTEAVYDSFDDRYLGVKASDPTLDNDGDALLTGALYFNSTDDVMKVYDGASWLAAYASLSGALIAVNDLSDLANAAAARTNLVLGNVDNTSDLDKPISTATQAEINTKAVAMAIALS